MLIAVADLEGIKSIRRNLRAKIDFGIFLYILHFITFYAQRHISVKND